MKKGTHQTLLDRHGHYHHLYMSQFKGEKIEKSLPGFPARCLKTATLAAR